MNDLIFKLKGVHPGLILEKELQKRGYRKADFAKEIGEFPQTITAITKGKRKINPELSIKIGKRLNMDQDAFGLLQTFYDLNRAKRKDDNRIPDVTQFRKTLFWDTSLDKIKWDLYKSSIIFRVFKYGNAIEKEEITKFYGKEEIEAILKKQLQNG